MKEEREKIAEGKTKIIWSFDDPGRFSNLVYIENKDNITAGDGLRRDVIEGKGALCARTAANVFLLLQRQKIPNHFVLMTEDGKTFLARRLLMMPVEVVVRRIARGSFCQRHPGTAGTVFEKPIVEFYLKDDRRHDPIVIWNGERDCFELYDAHMPISPNGYMGSLDSEQYIRSLGELKNICAVPKSLSDIITPKDLATEAFVVVEQAWQKQGYTMSDFKIEVGWNQSGKLEIGDVIGNDEWRLQVGETREEISKQCYRDLKEVAPEALNEIKRKYELVANLTDYFSR